MPSNKYDDAHGISERFQTITSAEFATLATVYMKTQGRLGAYKQLFRNHIVKTLIGDVRNVLERKLSDYETERLLVGLVDSFLAGVGIPPRARFPRQGPILAPLVKIKEGDGSLAVVWVLTSSCNFGYEGGQGFDLRAYTSNWTIQYALAAFDVLAHVGDAAARLTVYVAEAAALRLHPYDPRDDSPWPLPDTLWGQLNRGRVIEQIESIREPIGAVLLGSRPACELFGLHSWSRPRTARAVPYLAHLGDWPVVCMKHPRYYAEGGAD